MVAMVTSDHAHPAWAVHTDEGQWAKLHELIVLSGYGFPYNYSQQPRTSVVMEIVYQLSSLCPRSTHAVIVIQMLPTVCDLYFPACARN